MELNKNTTVLVPEAVMEKASTIQGENKVGFRVGLSDYFKQLLRGKRGSRRNPIAPGQADIVNWVIYDSNTVASNTTFAANYKFFTNPISSSKTKSQTNMTQVMRLDDPQVFNATNIGFAMNTNIAKVDLDSVLNTYYMEFWVGQKIYSEGPLFQFPSGTGAAGYAATTATTTTIQGNNNGMAIISNIYDMRLPAGMNLGAAGVTDGLIGIQILQGQSFKVELNGTSFTTSSTGNGITIYCLLQGILSRGVQ